MLKEELTMYWRLHPLSYLKKFAFFVQHMVYLSRLEKLSLRLLLCIGTAFSCNIYEEATTVAGDTNAVDDEYTKRILFFSLYYWG